MLLLQYVITSVITSEKSNYIHLDLSDNVLTRLIEWPYSSVWTTF